MMRRLLAKGVPAEIAEAEIVDRSAQLYASRFDADALEEEILAHVYGDERPALPKAPSTPAPKSSADDTAASNYVARKKGGKSGPGGVREDADLSKAPPAAGRYLARQRKAHSLWGTIGTTGHSEE